jgi:hypothetical protein
VINENERDGKSAPAVEVIDMILVTKSIHLGLCRLAFRLPALGLRRAIGIVERRGTRVMGLHDTGKSASAAERWPLGDGPVAGEIT